MTIHSEATEQAPSTPPPADVVFEPQAYFDIWWDQVQALHNQVASETPQSHQEAGSEMLIESFPGSNCEVTFEGVLHFDGHSIGNIRSLGGALVVTKRGIVDADIEVGVAVINGAVTGNITATERVLLDSDARVKGQIITRLLSVKPGALFEGDCVLVGSEESWLVDQSRDTKEPEELKQVGVGI
jgi:cytoskeletal protein CcmA (bactofilin family)